MSAFRLEVAELSKRSFVLIVAVFGLAALAAAYIFLQTRYFWPKSIQDDLFGEEVLNFSSQIKHENELAYGEGRVIWVYDLGADRAKVRQLCGEMPQCTVQLVVEEGVTIGVSVENDRATIFEEWR